MSLPARVQVQHEYRRWCKSMGYADRPLIGAAGHVCTTECDKWKFSDNVWLCKRSWAVHYCGAYCTARAVHSDSVSCTITGHVIETQILRTEFGERTLDHDEYAADEAREDDGAKVEEEGGGEDSGSESGRGRGRDRDRASAAGVSSGAINTGFPWWSSRPPCASADSTDDNDLLLGVRRQIAQTHHLLTTLLQYDNTMDRARQVQDHALREVVRQYRDGQHNFFLLAELYMSFFVKHRVWFRATPETISFDRVADYTAFVVRLWWYMRLVHRRLHREYLREQRADASAAASVGGAGVGVGGGGEAEEEEDDEEEEEEGDEEEGEDNGEDGGGPKRGGSTTSRSEEKAVKRKRRHERRMRMMQHRRRRDRFAGGSSLGSARTKAMDVVPMVPFTAFVVCIVYMMREGIATPETTLFPSDPYLQRRLPPVAAVVTRIHPAPPNIIGTIAELRVFIAKWGNGFAVTPWPFTRHSST